MLRRLVLGIIVAWYVDVVYVRGFLLCDFPTWSNLSGMIGVSLDGNDWCFFGFDRQAVLGKNILRLILLREYMFVYGVKLCSFAPFSRL